MRTLSSLLCQPAPDTAETTKLGAMRTQTSIPQFLHANETSENLSNALHAQFIHCLRLSVGPAAPRGVREQTQSAAARGRQVERPQRTARSPSQGSPTTAPPARLIASGSVAATPTSPFLFRARAPGRSGRACGGRTPSSGLSGQPASLREEASAHVTPARAY